MGEYNFSRGFIWDTENMTRINTGDGSHDIHYDDHEMSLSMKILKARLCQILLENKFYDLQLRKSYFVYFYKFGGDRGYEFNTVNHSRTIKTFKLHEPIRAYYKNGIEIFFDKDQGENGFSFKVLEKGSICKQCKSKKFIREDGFGYIESCQSCNPDFQLPFNFR
ncbi:hypothetical protein IRT38_00395 (plasmid) [Acinetobacter sp. SK-43]|uniref:hypothetical protein n=1 Tax=Acinetobacter sp. SK-43 TaxID=2785295 RepID=UPI00188B0E69|nr:hypothetical protein [Acinetobacter sp. SK-43]MBF4453873.1 hypothetical protein [Acinetobacter sp. SK-43]